MTMVLLPGEWSPDEAARYVIDAYAKSVAAVVETGRRLVEAKQSLPHGQWLPMVKLLPFSERTAQDLMRIALHDAIANAQHAADLPSSWTTLAVLAQLPPDEVAQRVKAKQITPEITRKQAQEWASLHQEAKQKRLQVWGEIADHAKGLLSALQVFAEPPADLPESHTQPEEITEWTAQAMKLMEAWND